MAKLENLPKGYLVGKVISSEKKEPVEKVKIYVKGLPLDATTDKTGAFNLELPEGNYSLSVIHPNYATQTVEGIVITAKETVKKTVEITPAGLELAEFVVLAPHIEGSLASVMAEEKNSNAIANVIGSEQMSKKGDSNAAAALKRVPGITLIGGKYVYVRGLGDRYSATELNNLALPSPNPLKRTVPLDMFPSSVIGSLQVQKSFSPDISGAFGGGYVNIRTKQTKDDDYAKVKFGLSMHSTMGQDVMSYQGSDSDWTGKDDGYRAFNSGLEDAMTPVIGEEKPNLDAFDNDQLQNMITKRSYNRMDKQVPLGKELSVEVSKNFNLGSDHEIGILANYGYKTEAEYREYTMYDYILSSAGVQTPTPDNIATNKNYKETVQQGGIANLAYRYENLSARYTKLYILNTLNQTRDVSGSFGENNLLEQNTYLEWQERELSADQLTMELEYEALFAHKLDAGIEIAKAKEYVPGDVYYKYRKQDEEDPYYFQRNISEMTIGNRSTADDVISSYIKNKTTIPVLSDDDNIEVGFSTEQKEREGRVNTMLIKSKVREEEITTSQIDTVLNYDADQLEYRVISQPKENYDASLDRRAYYIKTAFKPVDAMEVIIGARKEFLSQSVDQYDIVDNKVALVNSSLEFDKTLPSYAVKYAFNEQNQLKFAYAKTFVYPDFREFINSEFIHPEFVAKIAGNSELVETDIDSYDLQYGYYFDTIDNITVSLFYKEMQNPIEDVTTFTTSTVDRFSFDNSKSAELTGFELSWYKNLGFVYESLDSLAFSGNYTQIDSHVTLTEDQKRKFVTQSRPLQGLSPEVLNLSLTYQDDDRSLNLAYNKMAERLMRVAIRNGDVIFAHDDYEVPPQLLDFTWIEKFASEMLDTDFSMTFKAQNLLDDKTVWKQKELTTLEYKTGQKFSLSLEAKF